MGRLAVTKDWNAFHRAMAQVSASRPRPEAMGLHMCTICRRGLTTPPFVFLAIDQPGAAIPEQVRDPRAQVGFHGACHDQWYGELKAEAWALVARWAAGEAA